MNVRASSQRTVNTILSRFKWNKLQAYFDDVISFSNSFEDHFDQTHYVFSSLRISWLSLKFYKRKFSVSTIDQPDHVLSLGKVMSAERNLMLVRITLFSQNPIRSAVFPYRFQ